MKGSFKIDGAADVLKALRTLPKEYQEKELAKAPGRGARVVRDEARELAPVLDTPTKNRKPGTLRNAIRNTSGKRSLTAAAAYVFVKLLSKKAVRKFKSEAAKRGDRVGSRDNPDDPFYWRFQEFGTTKHPAANGGRGFLRPAFDSKKQLAARTIVDDMLKGIERAAKKVAGRRLF